MPRTSDQTRALFDQWAATYDDDLRVPGGPLAGYEQSLRTTADLMPVQSGDRLLDVGIGTGAFAARCARRGARISGIDVSDEMLARCRVAHPTFAPAVGSFTPIPHPARVFDGVVSSFALHEVALAARRTACGEIARVVKPGGYLCLLDIVASPVATAEARRVLGPSWDPAEDYPLVGNLDSDLRAAGIEGLGWRQTVPRHWVVIGRRPA